MQALSNQKYREMYEQFKDVGLMTGDVTINPSASCIVMTTEVGVADGGTKELDKYLKHYVLEDEYTYRLLPTILVLPVSSWQQMEDRDEGSG